MRINKLTLCAVLIVSLALTACISTSSEPEIVATRVVQVPTPAPPPDSFDLQTGAELFASSCAPCHGETGLGDGPSAAGFSCPMPAFANEGTNVDLEEWFRIASNGKRTGDTCIMPPWSGRLNPTQIWQAVIYAASLRHDYTLTSQGETVLASNQTTEDMPSYFTNSEWQVENTDAEILLAIQGNTLEGYNFTESLTDADQQAAIAYIRSLGYAGGTEVEVAAAQPQATEEAIDTSAEPQATEEAAPAPLATEEVSDGASTGSPSGGLVSPLDDIAPEETLDTVTITGVVTNGTEGGTVPSDLIVKLRVVRINEAGDPEEVVNTDAPINADNTFTFSDVPRPQLAIASVETEYAGIRQFAPHIILDTIEDNLVPVDFVIYETTNNADLSFLYIESLVDAVTAEGTSLTYQNFEVVNNSDRVYIGDENGRTATITFPTGAINAEVDTSSSVPTRFERIEDGDQTIIYDTDPIFPGTIQQYTTRFNYLYDGSMELEQSFPLSVQEMGVYVSDTRGLRLESGQLVQIDPVSVNNLVYNGYGLASAPLPAGSTVTFRVFDDPNATASSSSSTSTASDDENFFRENTTLILGIGVLLVIAGVMFMIYDLQRKRIEVQAAGAGAAKIPNNQDDLIAAIAKLDKAYEKGKIDEEEYEEERERLKAALRRLL